MALKPSVAFAREFWQGRTEENRNIVNVSSIAAVNAYPNRGQSIYGAAKAAVNQLTRHMAYEFGAIGLRTNALALNTFPTIVPLEDVVHSLTRLDTGRQNDKVVVIDRDGEHLL